MPMTATVAFKLTNAEVKAILPTRPRVKVFSLPRTFFLHDHGMTTKLIPECGKELVRKRLSLAGPKTLKKGKSDYGNRDTDLHCLLYRPSALPGIFHIPFNQREVPILFKCSLG